MLRSFLYGYESSDRKRKSIHDYIKPSKTYRDLILYESNHSLYDFYLILFETEIR